MTDKDETERSVIKDLFPGAQVYLCQFHVLQIFQRMFTKSKMNISEKIRLKLLFFLKKMSNSRSPELYELWYRKFVKIASIEALEYFEKNWNCIKHQWVKAYMADSSFFNFTNNRLESINGQIKKAFIKILSAI